MGIGVPLAPALGSGQFPAASGIMGLSVLTKKTGPKAPPWVFDGGRLGDMGQILELGQETALSHMDRAHSAQWPRKSTGQRHSFPEA